MTTLKPFLILAAFIAVGSGDKNDDDQAFNSFTQRHGKKYKDDNEKNQRRDIFVKKLREIEAHNDKFKTGSVTWEMGVNEFSDRTDEELKPFFHGLKMPPLYSASPSNDQLQTRAKRQAVPASCDWRTSGAVSPVKNQGNCSSCWAFSTSSAFESHNFIKTNQMVLISDQNLVDCVYNTSGCAGGWYADSYNYVKSYKLDTQTSYPYTAAYGACRYNASNLGISSTVLGWNALQQKNETQFKNTVGTIGPVSVAIDATNLLSYKSGIFSDTKCSSTVVTHAVLLVGYGTTTTNQNYYIVKNSWGSSWGENGYFRIVRGNNKCGITLYGFYPVLQ